MPKRPGSELVHPETSPFSETYRQYGIDIDLRPGDSTLYLLEATYNETAGVNLPLRNALINIEHNADDNTASFKMLVTLEHSLTDAEREHNPTETELSQIANTVFPNFHTQPIKGGFSRNTLQATGEYEEIKITTYKFRADGKTPSALIVTIGDRLSIGVQHTVSFTEIDDILQCNASAQEAATPQNYFFPEQLAASIDPAQNRPADEVFHLGLLSCMNVAAEYLRQTNSPVIAQQQVEKKTRPTPPKVMIQRTAKIEKSSVDRPEKMNQMTSLQSSIRRLLKHADENKEPFLVNLYDYLPSDSAADEGSELLLSVSAEQKVGLAFHTKVPELEEINLNLGSNPDFAAFERGVDMNGNTVLYILNKTTGQGAVLEVNTSGEISLAMEHPSGKPFTITNTKGTKDNPFGRIVDESSFLLGLAYHVLQNLGGDPSVVTNLSNIPELSNNRTEEESKYDAFSEIKGQDAAIEQIKTHVKGILSGVLEEGVILYGPPGTGKTRLGHAISNYVNGEGEVEEINAGNIYEGAFYTGSAESNLATIFTRIEKRLKAGEEVVVLLDELDSLNPINVAPGNQVPGRVQSSLIANIAKIRDSYPHKVILVGMCNNIASVPEPIKRSGRLGKHIKIGLPNEEGLVDLFTYYAASINKNLGETGANPAFDPVELNLHALAQEASGLSGADIESIMKTLAVEVEGGFVTNSKIIDAIIAKGNSKTV